jgi:hypothetical protein
MAARIDEKGRYCDWHTAPSLKAAWIWADRMMAKTGQIFVVGECLSACTAPPGAARPAS